MARVVKFDVRWDAEAEVWWASAASGEGIVTEADTIEALRSRLRVIVPDFLEAVGERPDDIEIQLTAHLTDHVKAA